jgi:hypothetical protein
MEETMKQQQRQRPNIVSVHLSPEAKANLDMVCEQRGMTIKSLLGRLIEWFVELDKTEQSIVLKQVEVTDVTNLAELVLRRGPRGGGNGPGEAEARAGARARRRRVTT